MCSFLSVPTSACTVETQHNMVGMAGAHTGACMLSALLITTPACARTSPSACRHAHRQAGPLARTCCTRSAKEEDVSAACVAAALTRTLLSKKLG